MYGRSLSIKIWAKDMNKNQVKKKKFSNRFINGFLLICIILISFFVRLYKVDAPITDRFSKEQAEVLMSTKELFNPVTYNTKPVSENSSNDTTAKLYNPSRFPLTEYSIGSLTKVFPNVSITLIGRFVMIVSSLIIMVCLFFLALRLSGRISATIAILFAGLSPYFVLHSRIINNFIVPLTIIHIGIVFLYLALISRQYKAKSIFYIIVSLFCTALALVTEPMLIIFMLPVGYLLLRKYGINSFRTIQIYLYIFICLLPLLIYNLLNHSISQLIPLPIWSNSYEGTTENTTIFFLNKIFLSSVLKDRIINAMLGSFGIAIVFLGIIKKVKKGTLFSLILLSSVIFLLLFSGENFQNESLQLILMTPISLFFGIGMSVLFHHKDDTIQYKSAYPAMIVILLVSVYFSFFAIRPDYNHNYQIVQVAKIINVITKPNDRIATDTKGDKSLLVLSDRMGIPSTDSGESNLIQNNIRYLVTFNKGYAKTLSKQYKQIFSSSNGYIFQLQ